MRYRVVLLGWLLSDLLLFGVTYAAAYALRVGFILSTDFPFDRFLLATFLAAPVWLIALMTTRSFALTRIQHSMRNGLYLTFAALIGIATFTLTYYFLFTAFFSRLLLVIAFLLSAGGSWGWHMLYAAWFRRILIRKPAVFPTLIVGVTRESQALIARLQRTRNPLHPVAVLDARGVKDADIHGVAVRGKLNKLEDVLAEGITHVIHCSDVEQSINLLSACRSRNITYILLPSVLGIVEGAEHSEPLEGIPVTVVSTGPRWQWFFR